MYFECTNFFENSASVIAVPPPPQSAFSTEADHSLEHYAHRVLKTNITRNGGDGTSFPQHGVLTSVGDADIDAAAEEFLNTHVITPIDNNDSKLPQAIGALLHDRDTPLHYNCALWWWLTIDDATKRTFLEQRLDADSIVSAPASNIIVAGLLSFKIAVLKFRKHLSTSEDTTTAWLAVAPDAAAARVSDAKMKLLGVRMPPSATNSYAQAPIHGEVPQPHRVTSCS